MNRLMTASLVSLVLGSAVATAALARGPRADVAEIEARVQAQVDAGLRVRLGELRRGAGGR